MGVNERMGEETIQKGRGEGEDEKIENNKRGGKTNRGEVGREMVGRGLGWRK